MAEPTVGSETGAATVAGVLRARAAERPEQVAFTFLADGETEGGRLTYGELDRRAAAVAAALAAAVRPGDRALLLYPPGLDFIAAFFGCLYAGVVAVPAYPPRPNDRSQSRLRAIAHDATPRAALTTDALLAGAVEARGLLAVAPELAGLRWIPTDALGGGAAASDLPEPDPESVAFLQYTSGSTAAPKGVMVTHANLLHNERMIGAAFGMDESSVVVGWLPLYHDMGLIGNVLQPLHAGGTCVLMSPVAFLQRPMRWLEAIGRYRGTTSGGPNFAYELCVRKASPEALAGLDLSSWRVAYDGAEPVRASTLERFATTFAPSGFRAEAFYPCYGLAEATLFVTGGVPGRAPRVDAASGRVSCGRPWMGARVVVADPESGVERPAGSEGEIWIAGPSVARGYWENPEATALDFNAFLATGEGPFLRTGDLGVLAADGELFVSGRLKDLIILRGRNLYPQDVELTAESAHPDLQPGGGAAFAVEAGGDGGEERLVIVHEVARHRKAGIEEIAEAVRRAVAAEHEAQVYEVVLIRQAGLPKTSSGKVQRRRCRELYRAGELPVVGRSALTSEEPALGLEPGAALTPETLAGLDLDERRTRLAGYLRERAAAALGVPAAAVALDQPLTGLGLDSLSAIELKGSVESALGLALPLADLLQGASARDLAAASLPEPGGEALPPLRALDGEGDAPLSPGQAGLWFLHRLAPEGGAYNIAVAARAPGLDVAAFARALEALTARHEALRTIFPMIGDGPVQRVLPEPAPDILVETTEEAGEELARRLAAEAWRPFVLERGPLLRTRVFLGPDGETILIAVHHIVADFASLAVMARDLAALYRGEALARLPLRYTDFVRWQAEALAGARGERLWAYWRRQLAGVSDLDLPADHPRPPVQTWRGDSRAVSLPPGLAGGIGALAAGRGATPFMALLAGFQAQLARYSGQEDFAIGSALAGRSLPELAGVVGYFVNLLPLRADLGGEPGFAALLDRARRTALAGMEHGDFPFPVIAERLRPVRDPARPPVFQAMLVFQRARAGDPAGLAPFSLGEAGARLDLGGLALESVRLPERRAQLDLALFVAEDGRGGLQAVLEFNADLFDGGTAERMLGHLQTLLAGAVASPETPVWHLPLLAPAERRQVIAEWNATARAEADWNRELLLHQLFEAQAARSPAAEALVFGETRLTYAELNAAANRLAHRLRRLGVGPEVRVGLCLRRSERMIVALFAVLKAGGAYVPMDPGYPRERLALILEDSGARVVLAEEATGEVAALANGVRWLSLDADDAEAAAIAGESADDPEAVAAPANLAYLIYTSGSTGRPKAVAVEHRSPVALMEWAREAFSAAELAGVLGATSIGFDVSVFEIFAPLSWGGRLLIAENLLALRGMPAAGEVRLICAVPSVMAELVRAGRRLPGGVRTVNLAGEAVPPALVAELAAALPEARILDIYGPSEDTVYSTLAPLEPGREVTIGLPLTGGRAHVLDRRGEPAPVGVPGELCLAGAGLARGYLRRPDLTAERFVPDPFAAESGAGPGGRLYRTGDLARRRADGRIDYLGRTDQQVKVRGFRIELGEVEAALARHPRLREAAVVARDEEGGGKRLVAYVAPAGVPAAELRAFLREILPDSMVPTAFVGLDALPLSPTGKVDRRALPEPGGAAAGEGEATGFRTPVEELLAGVTAEVLGIERVGPRDDFFALGGHSLLATRLLARVSSLFGVDLPVSSVFQYPTVASLAERIAAVSSGDVVQPVLPVPPVPRPDGWAMPLSFAQRGLWLIDRITPGSPAYHLPGAVRLSGPLDLAILEAALAAVVGRHEALRTVFRVLAGEPWQVLDAPAVALPQVDLAALPTEAAGAEAGRVAQEVAVAPFDLARGPLWRVVAFRVSPVEHLLAITLHHIVADGWSLEILVAELAALYEAAVAGRSAALPALPVQYADWAAWQRERLAGGRLEAEVDWWREQLAGSTPLELPVDRPPTALRTGRGGTWSAVLPAAASAALERLARREGATPFMVLLAAFQAQLARYTGAPRIAVGSPVANRGRAEVENLIGVFVNMLVLRTPVSGDPGFREHLGRVREVCLGAYAHQELPFERLVEELRPERQGGRTPFFQVLFRLEQPVVVERLGEAAAEVRRLETGTAKLDLTLGVTREPAGFTAVLEYDADLFDPTTIDRLLGHWRTLAEGIAAGPELRLSELPLLAPAEAAQLRAWSGAGTDYPRQATIHGLFAGQAARAPQAVALSRAGRPTSYADLDARSDRLASRLIRFGAGVEARIGLAVESAPALIAGMLGILKAGGAYVPLDPAYPSERLAWMAEDAGLNLLVVEKSLAGSLPVLFGTLEILVDADGELVGGNGGNGGNEEPPPAVPVEPENLAYVMYTSGSTGQPKGVEVTHRGVVRLVRGAGYARFGPDEVFLQLAPAAFDAATFEIWGALLNGARLALLPGRAPLLDELGPAVAGEGVTTLWLTAGLFHSVIESRPEVLRGVTQLLAGGDVLSASHVRRAFAALPGVTVIDGYGPTENTTFTTCHPMRDAAEVEETIPIGRPIANTTVHVLDGDLRPAPVGVPGELYAGGDGLARGYHRRPELTAERFVPSPFLGGERLYRTGDLARWRADGALEFLGRRDQQVKIRGFRVEVGEIEAALLRLPGVAEAAVVAREEAGGKALTAYAVPRWGEGLPEDLDERLRELLPEHMIPARLIALAELPLNPNGKVDRRALAALDPLDMAGPAASTPPRTLLEERLAAIWREVLEKPKIGVHDDFFTLGGHSLLAIRVLAQIQEQMGLEISMTDLFEAPTVAGLAERMAAGHREAAAVAELPPESPDLRPGPRSSGRAVEPPSTPLEERLAAIWREVLKLPEIGVHDDFFALGGHSLLAIRVLARIEDAFGVDLSVGDLVAAPTIAELAARLGRGDGAAAPSLPSKPPALPAEILASGLPLSLAQQRLWLLDRLEPGGASYNVPVAVRLEGELDTAALARALAALVGRHEPLRTVYALVGEEPVQVVLPDAGEAGLPFARLDLAGLPAAERERALRDALNVEGSRPFDLARGPVARFLLAGLGERDRVLLTTIHHIATDGWSMSVFFRELAALYGDFAAGRTASLPALPLRYADWAARQRGTLGSGALDSQLAYWRRQLAGVPVLELPADRPRGPEAGERGALRPVEIPAGLTEPFRGQGGGITPFTVLLAGYLALLTRLSGADDLAVGIPAAGRRGLQTEGMIGFFVNTLVVRPALEGDPGFAALLGRVRDAVLAAQAHQDVPFERLVEELQPDRAAGVSPFFQVMFAYLANPLAPAAIPGVALTLLDAGSLTAKYDLTLSIYDEGDSLRAWLEYRTALFDAATADRWAGHLRTLLAGAAADPLQPLSELPLLSPAQRRQVLDHAESADLGVEPARLLHELFERAAAAAPERAALVMGEEGGELTYGELNARANRLGRFLAELGAGPEVPVGICLDRTPDAIVAFLAVLKAGGVYVPLDPAYPPERLDYMLADSGARVLVSRAGLAVRPAGGPDLRRALLDADRERIAAQAPGDLGVPLAPANLAYVIYTSGSTGRPKGVEIAHGAIVRHAEMLWRYYAQEPDDRMLTCSSLSFDASVEAIFVAFGAGATLVFRGEEVWGGEKLAERLVALDVTTADLATPLWHSLTLDAGTLATPPPRLRLIATGGEEMLTETARLWGRSPLAAVHLFNGYGPTEAVVTSTLHTVDPGGEPAGSSVALGRPLPEHTLHILDARLAPQPIGLEGEIYLGGLIARGYHGRPDLTAASFVPDPFSGRPGERLYRTGDLARRRADGDVLFLGRRDGQVKLRGFRIETGEIESALLACPGVREAVVQVVTLGGERRLAAWIAPPGVAAADLQAFLGERLPAYMIPTAFTAVPAMPLTPSGKVDRRALPAPVAGDEEEGRALGPLEELLAGIWRPLLGVERVRAEDGFFELGGHSLIATRLVSRVRSAFGVELPLAAVFEAPTLEGLARRLATALGEPPAVPAPPIVAVPRDPAGEPLSFAQKRLWFLHGLDPESSAYNVPGALLLRGPLRTDGLAAAMGEIVRRHEALRTVFRDAPGEPVQVVLPPAALPLPVIDLGGLPAAARQGEAERILAAEGRRPFDLAAGPLLRTELIRLGGEEHLLAVLMHHIVSDAWSLGVTFRELSALYRAFAAGEPSPLPPPAVQYADFARWQRSWLSGEVLAAELEHWRRTLDGAPAALELPADRPRPASTATAALAGNLPFALPPDLAAALRGLAQREGWSLFMALLAAFDAVLARWSGQRDLVVGAPIANRNRQEVEGLIGFFTNTLALRLDLAGDPSFAEIARRARAATLDGYAHQELPFERVVEEVAPERDPARTPLFQVMLVVQHDPAAGLSLPGLATEVIEIPLSDAKFDLTLFLTESGGGIAGHLELNRALFDLATGERLLGHLGTLIASAVADPSARLSELPLLTAAEQAELLAWTAPLNLRPEPRCLHEWVAERAALAPEAEAVVFGGERLTYGELMRRASTLAARLRAAGVGPDVPVGLYLGRSLDMMVAVLGVLRAGGAYVPLDPTYPRERLRLMLEDAGAPVVLTHGPLAAAAPEGLAALAALAEVMLVDDVPADPLKAPLEIAAGATPENLAYVTYTSGSTGRPKGVAMTHAAISAMLAWQLRTSAAGGGRTLQYTSLSFDVSCQEIFGTWCAGGTLVLVSEEVRRDPAALVRLLAEERIERLFQPFVALQQLAMAAADDGPLPAALREVMSAGEQLHVTPQVAALFARLPGISLYNHYGPSETHAATWLALHGDPGRWPESPTIGGPLDHARVFLLDADLRPVPVGVPGELWIGGVGLARGYMRADLTAERFLPDPLAWSPGWEPGGRLYRTGDLARRLASGELEFLGRRDHQVKVRGHRVETAEVELALARHPAILQAAVAVRGDSAGARRLVAYVVFREDGAPPTSGELRAFLADSLPDPMVPTAWARLAALPVTPTGKLDRRALARLHPDESWSGDEGFVAPRNPVEELLAGIWREVLGADRIGVHDDFFQLGGHSLLATQVASRVRRAFGIDLPLRRVFELPTPAALAGAVAEALEGAAETATLEAPPILPRGSGEGDPPLSFAQERLWYLHRVQPESPAYNIPLALRAEGPLDPSRLAWALSEVARRHEVLRTVFAERGGGPVQVVLPPAGVPLPAVNLGALPAARREAEARRIAAEEAARPFDLEAGPLLRCLLVELAPRHRVVLLDFHHVVTDGWSLGVLVREVKALYGGETLPGLPVQYADFAVWQRRWLSGDVLERQLAYWRERLTGASALDLPTDRPRPPRGFAGAFERFSLGTERTGGLAALSRRHGATLFMTLLAAFQALLGRYTGQDDVVVGSPIANRNHAETEGLIGFFVNSLVLRGDLSGDPEFSVLLDRTRRRALEAYGHQDLPFDRLVEELRPERRLSQNPLFQVVCALQNAPLAAVELPGLSLAPVDDGFTTARFDLELVFWQAGDGLAGQITYGTELFDPATIRRLAGHFETLTGAVLADPGLRLSRTPLLTGAESHQLLQEWSGAASREEPAPDVVTLFELWAARTPEAPAVVSAEGTLTYGELDRRAGRLARRLRSLGVGPDMPVGLHAPRSPEMVIGALAVLKAGAAYVPLDPAQPPARLAFVVRESRIPVLLAAGPAAGPDLVEGARVLRIGEEEGADVSDAALSAASAPAPEGLAYVVYTSGSTGQPKGVEISRAGLANLVRWHLRTYGVTARDRTTQVATPAFDAAVWEVWSSLAAGASLHLPDEETRLLPERLLAWLEAERITLCFLPTPLAEQLLDAAERALPEGLSLRALLTGGDRLVRAPRRPLPFALFNHYGPTESSVVATWAPVADSGGGRPPSIGRPIDGTVVYVLAPGLTPVPAGVPGELLIGGVGLARGYLGRPDVTAERFVPDPFSTAGAAGERLYRTGDLVRQLADGTLDFLGRIDHQVKVRGYRIELGEIEAALLRHPAVLAVAVLAREDVPGEQRLVAYLVPAAGEPLPAAAGLRAFLQETLPEHMVPWSFVELGSLPVTANGKLDREALPAPRDLRGETAHVAPRNDLERTIAAAWREVLELDRIDVEENFFEAGGSSLLLARLQSRLSQALGRDVPFVELFRHPTIESLARSLEGEAPPPAEKAEAARARTETRRESMKQLQQMRGQRRGRKGEQ